MPLFQLPLKWDCFGPVFKIKDQYIPVYAAHRNPLDSHVFLEDMLTNFVFVLS